ncbi:MAG: RNA pseudouridine synthase [Pirellulales bacterium]
MEQLDVIFEDNHLLVINKPSGIATMGVESGEVSIVTLAADYLRHKYAKPGNVFVGVVSRLDSLASGVLVLARTSKAASRLSEQIREQSTSKRYLALVEGRVNDQDKFTSLEHYLKKNDAAHRVQVVDRSLPGAQLAKLNYRSLFSVGNNSVLEVELITGRKHQIRVQLSEVGLTIVGDAKYGSKVIWPNAIGLHCYQNGIVHPTLKTPMTFHSLPTHWQSRIGDKAIDQLRMKLSLGN